MTTEPSGPPKRRRPPRGSRPPTQVRRHFIAVRCNAEEHAAITEAATKAGLSVGAYLRTQALGSPGPRSVRRPPVERRELSRLIGLLGKLGSNVNQLAHGFNGRGMTPGLPELIAARRDIGLMRADLMKVLGRGD